MSDDDRTRRFAGYAQARLLLPDDDGRTLVVVPVDGPGDPAGFPGPDDVLHVLTAFDPGPRRLPRAENERRQQALVASLPPGVHRREAVAGAEDGSHTEDSVVVGGLSDDEALALARAWGQDAIFRWTRVAWSIVPCDGAPASSSGWVARRRDARVEGADGRRPGPG